MLGNWSLGDYFKEDAITWSYEFLISKDEGLGLDPKRLYITCFEGDEDAPRDIESFEIWKKVGIPENRIYFFGKKENWWSPGDNGPCGPDSEMFYDVTGTLGDIEKDGFIEADNKQQIVEIWNDVFMEYEKKDGKVIGKLKQQNVDTGAGLERLAMVMQDTDNVFDTDLFQPLMKTISEHSRASDVRAERIVADHIRTATFIIADGVTPSNTDRGYILRRLIRRAVRYADVLGIEAGTLPVLARTVIGQYKDVYGNFEQQEGVIVREIEDEEQKFRKTLDRGMKEFKKIAQNNISGADAFILFSTYGFPLELTVELALEKGISVDEEGFQAEMKKHQEQSRAGGEQKFKGGLADTSEMSVKYHTATHLLHQALRDVLGNHVQQKGSNITPERLRFDFSFDRKLSDEERKQVEDAVNERIEDSLSVSYEDVPLEEAKNRGAIGLFEEQYGDTVRVYKIGDPSTGSGQVYSLELCGGPHVKNTSELGHFTIKKEEAVAAGTRRIKAVLK
jgi:alanyl-tRNA synthetase